VALACESDATTVAQHVLETAEERTAEVVEEMLIYLFFSRKKRHRELQPFIIYLSYIFLRIVKGLEGFMLDMT
jgi:hypothetical protein